MPKIEPKSTLTSESQHSRVLLETSLGNIEIELFPDKAPITVDNFLQYVNNDFYINTVFHRVIPGFMIQGGGFGKDMVQKDTLSPIKNEAGNGLSNLRGTIAMARTQVVDSATAQFFINVVDNTYLDHRDETSNGFGYCVFGRVINGMDVVDKIANVSTTTVGYFQNVPVENIIILAAKLVK